MRKILLVLVLSLVFSGCASMIKNSLPTCLTSRDMMWTIPAGTAFKAIQKPAYPTLTEFVVTDDLKVVYAGNLMELEQEANKKVINTARTAKKQGVLWGILGSIFSVVAAVVGKKVVGSATDKKKK